MRPWLVPLFLASMAGQVGTTLVPADLVDTMIYDTQPEGEEGGEAEKAQKTEEEKKVEGDKQPGEVAPAANANGGSPPAEAEAAPADKVEEQQEKNGPEMDGLQRQLAFLQEDDSEVETAKCKRCHMDLDLAEAIIRGPKELWCKECNSLYSMLRRHQSWPPPNFASLSEDAQAAFWQKCKKEKEESKKSQFSYASDHSVG